VSKLGWVLIVLACLIVGGVIVATATGAKALAPARSPFHYPWALLAEEAEVMNECRECHKPEDFHTCSTCHDDHGSAELAGVPFNDLLVLTGDVPEPGYIPVNDILPYRDQPGTHVALLDFLTEQGVEEFESVTFASRDGRFVTVERENLTPSGLLMPHVEGMRFADENLHVSTWLKGIWRMVVVGTERPLSIDGEATSMGRLLLGSTVSVIVEPAKVMLSSEDDGQIRSAQTASRVEGVSLRDLFGGSDELELIVRDVDGQEHYLTPQETGTALLAMPWIRPEIMVVLPARGRSQWIGGVIAVEEVK